MSKSSRPSVSFEKLMSLVEASGLPVEDKANYKKIGPKWARLYVPKTTEVRQIDLSGDWAKDFRPVKGDGWCPNGILPLRAPNGGVQCHIDLADEGLALMVFAELLTIIGQTPEPKKPEPKAKAEKPAKVAGAPAPRPVRALSNASLPAADNSPEACARRLAALKSGILKARHTRVQPEAVMAADLSDSE